MDCCQQNVVRGIQQWTDEMCEGVNGEIYSWGSNKRIVFSQEKNMRMRKMKEIHIKLKAKTKTKAIKK